MAQKIFAPRQNASSRLQPDGSASLAPRLTVLLVDARPWTREALARALETASKDLHVSCVSDVTELAQTNVEGNAVVVLNLIGSQCADCSASSMMANVRAALPNLPVVVLSEHLNPEDILDAIRQGLNGYIPLSMEVKLVIEALRFVVAGGTFVPADLLLDSLDAGMLSTKPAARDGTGTTLAPDAAAVLSLLNTLTPRERGVLHVLRQGKSNKHIARELDMREATVKVHVRHIMRKLRVSNRTQVALLADHLTEKHLEK
jgi:DNA-binding NarL/FixJ family response regulator